MAWGFERFACGYQYQGGIQIASPQREFNWRSYLALAELLGKSSDDEAKLRSSISRAYYAAFCTACNFISHVDHKPLPNDVPIHQYVANYFGGKTHGSKKNNKRAKIGSELRRMRADRVIADYDGRMSNMKSLNATVKDILFRSERVISSLKKGGL